jgi:hypothetical protein
MKHIRILPAVLFFLAALCSAALAVTICRTGPETETVFLAEPADSRLTAESFFEAVCAGRYKDAYAFLSGSSDLGLQNEPRDESERLLYDALRGSYAVSLGGEAVRTGTTAALEADFTCLDVPALMGGIHDDVNTLLAIAVENAKYAGDVYNGDGSYRDEVVRAAYLQALKERIGRAEQYYTTVRLKVTMEYRDRAWQIVPDEAMMDALAGVPGAAGRNES